MATPLSRVHSVAPPPTPPAEEVDRQRRRFNMRMLVPGRPVKETQATPPPIPTERPAYKEKFIPPELSMWDYFVAKVSAPSQLLIDGFTDCTDADGVWFTWV